MTKPDTTTHQGGEPERQYTVLWSIDLTATSFRAAAQQALEIQRDAQSTAVVFDVFTHEDPPVRIDLADSEEDPALNTAPDGPCTRRQAIPARGASLAATQTDRKPGELVPAATDGFKLDRGRLADSVGAENDQDAECGIQQFGETHLEQVAGALLHAEGSKALHIPDGVYIYALKLDPDADALIIAVRETPQGVAANDPERQAAGLPDERQIATWTIDPRWLSDPQDETFGGLCQTLEEICDIANRLLTSLRALMSGERQLLKIIAAPLRVLTYDDHGRFASWRANVADITEHHPENARLVWPLLLETLRRGEASEDWDGERQRAFQLEEGGQRHLARQLVALRDELAAEGKVPADALPDPDGGFERYLA